LHKYLQQTLIDYDVEKHLGGVYYLYLRGMNNEVKSQQGNQQGNQGDQQRGVYYRQITTTEIKQLTLIFAEQHSAAEISQSANKCEDKNV
jgi:exodeoxyribonuclease V beta subunit